MSSEVSQLCLEALTPLAEQCAKAQDTDSPLLAATRHFLKVSVYDLFALQYEGGRGRKEANAYPFLLISVGL